MGHSGIKCGCMAECLHLGSFCYSFMVFMFLLLFSELPRIMAYKMGGPYKSFK